MLLVGLASFRFSLFFGGLGSGSLHPKMIADDHGDCPKPEDPLGAIQSSKISSPDA